MAFRLLIPRPGEGLELTLNPGECVFVLGANGTGKSSLMQRFFSEHHANARRISAHRQTWFTSNAITLSPEQKRQTEASIQGTDRHTQARWKDDYSAARPSLAIYDLIDAENVRARSIAGAVDTDNIELAKALAKKDAPIKIINELLRLSNIAIEIAVQQNDQVVARKAGGPAYSIAELSDGERNAVLIASDVLTVKPGTLLLIDEPERHLHRSIISPLITLLFARRPDCAFVVSTHEVMLPLDNPGARVVLIRGCTYAGNSVGTYDADLVSPGGAIDNELVRDILGSRRKLLFIEGTEQSMDKPLYSLLFPNVSVIAKEGCRDVEHSVSGIRHAEELHWVKAFGIVDGDGRAARDVQNLKEKGIYALTVFSVESIYYHPDVQRKVAERHASVTGEDASTRLEHAKTGAIAAVNAHSQRLSERVAEKAVRAAFLQRLPNRNDIAASGPINVLIDVAAAVQQEKSHLQRLLQARDLVAVTARYPIRETSALIEVARKLGFQNREQYESAVRKLFMDDRAALDHARSLFGTLPADIEAA